MSGVLMFGEMFFLQVLNNVLKLFSHVGQYVCGLTIKCKEGSKFLVQG